MVEGMKKTTTEIFYTHAVNILLIVYYVGGFFMWSGKYPLVSLFVAMLAANAPWIFLILGVRADKR